MRIVIPTDEQWNDLPEVATLREFANLFQCCYELLVVQVKRGHLQSIKLDGRHIAFKSELRRFITQHPNLDPIVLNKDVFVPNYWVNDSAAPTKRILPRTFRREGYAKFHMPKGIHTLDWNAAPEFDGVEGWTAFILNRKTETVWRHVSMCGVRHLCFGRTRVIYREDLMDFYCVGKELEIEPEKNEEDLIKHRPEGYVFVDDWS